MYFQTFFKIKRIFKLRSKILENIVKQIDVFLLFFKIGENNFYTFSKNYSLFHFIFKNYFKEQRSN